MRQKFTIPTTEICRNVFATSRPISMVALKERRIPQQSIVTTSFETQLKKVNSLVPQNQCSILTHDPTTFDSTYDTYIRLASQVPAVDRKWSQETDHPFAGTWTRAAAVLLSSKEPWGEEVPCSQKGGTVCTGNVVGGRELLSGTKHATRVGDRYKGIV